MRNYDAAKKIIRSCRFRWGVVSFPNGYLSPCLFSQPLGWVS